jgi:hypothetical protein
MRGAPLKAVQELLGHSDIKMTMRNAHLAPEVKREAVMLLDKTASGSVRFQVPPKSPNENARLECFQPGDSKG